MALAALALVVGACSGNGAVTSGGVVEEDEDEAAPVGPQTYAVNVDVPSPAEQNLQASIFLPVNLRVKPGDTIAFANRSDQVAHTVTFGPGDALSTARPSPVTAAGQPNPLVFKPCFAAALPPEDSVACPAPQPDAPAPFDGTSFWHSGALAPATSGAAGGTVAMTVAPDTPPGTYDYVCLLHADMTGLVEVLDVDEGDRRDSPEEVAEEAMRRRSVVLIAGGQLAEPAPPVVDGPAVTAGWGDRLMAINRFAPNVITVEAGETVTWSGAHPTQPHTVTFRSPFATPTDPGVFTAAGVKRGGRFAGGFAHSGLMGPAPARSETFSLTFTKPGTYSYVCALHPGMAGRVVVT